MTNSSPQPSASHQQVLEELTDVPTHGYQQDLVLTPALRVSDRYVPRWLPPHAPIQPQPTSAPVQGMHCPQAVPFQQLTLDGLNNDVLAIAVDFLCDGPIRHRSFGREEPKTSFYFRAQGSSLFCLSLVSKRMRAISIPKLFAHVFRCTSSMGTLNRRLRYLESNPLIPSLPEVLPAIKYVQHDVQCGHSWMQWNHYLDEAHDSVAKAFFQRCPALKNLSLVHTDEAWLWQPVRGRDGAQISRPFLHRHPAKVLCFQRSAMVRI